MSQKQYRESLRTSFMRLICDCFDGTRWSTSGWVETPTGRNWRMGMGGEAAERWVRNRQLPAVVVAPFLGVAVGWGRSEQKWCGDTGPWSSRWWWLSSGGGNWRRWGWRRREKGEKLVRKPCSRGHRSRHHQRGPQLLLLVVSTGHCWWWDGGGCDRVGNHGHGRRWRNGCRRGGITPTAKETGNFTVDYRQRGVDYRCVAGATLQMRPLGEAKAGYVFHWRYPP